MDKITKYMLPEDTNRLYKTEAISSISLSKEVAEKINEIIDYINVLYKDDVEKTNDLEGKIRKAVIYMKDNLSNSLVELLDIMKANGELDSLIEKTLTDVKAEVEKTNIYYDNVTCERLHDEISDCDYYVTTIPKYDSLGNPIKLEVGIANDDENVNTLESTLAFSHRKNATVCVNAGTYDVDTYYPTGTLIKDYKVLYDKTPVEAKFQFLGIKANGEIKVYPYTTPASKMLSDGMKDVICIFGALIKEGALVEQTDLRVDVRQSIGIKEDGTIIFISCDGRTRVNKGMSYDDIARLHLSRGVREAHILDGGGSTSTIVEGVKVNENIDYNIVDRKVNNFLYIVKEHNVTPENNAANLVGDVKQELLEEIRTKIDFLNGYIRIIGPENYYAPGIEMYVNNGESRTSKLGLTYNKDNQRGTYLYWGLKGPEDTSEKTNLFRIYPQGTWIQLYHGPSSDRPNGIVGLCYFDEGYGKPIWYNGTEWVDATGTKI